MPQNERRLYSRMRKGSGNYKSYVVLGPTTIGMFPVMSLGFTGRGIPAQNDRIVLEASPGLTWKVLHSSYSFVALELEFGGISPWGDQPIGTVFEAVESWGQVN